MVARWIWVIYPLVALGSVGPHYIDLDCPDGCCYANTECWSDANTMFEKIERCVAAVDSKCTIRLRAEFVAGGTDLLWAQTGSSTEVPGAGGAAIDTSSVFQEFPDIYVEEIGFVHNFVTTCSLTEQCFTRNQTYFNCHGSARWMTEKGGYDHIPTGALDSTGLFRVWTRDMSREAPVLVLLVQPRSYWDEEPEDIDPSLIAGNKYHVENCGLSFGPDNNVFLSFMAVLSVTGGEKVPQEDQMLGIEGINDQWWTKASTRLDE